MQELLDRIIQASCAKGGRVGKIYFDVTEYGIAKRPIKESVADFAVSGLKTQVSSLKSQQAIEKRSKSDQKANMKTSSDIRACRGLFCATP